MRKHLLALLAAAALGALVLVPPASADPRLDGGMLGRQPQAIAMSAIPPTSVDQTVAIEASATSLLPVEIALSGNCAWRQLLGGSVVVATDRGDCTITADQPGDRFWLPAPTVQQTFAFLGGEAGVRIVVGGPQWLLAAQGLPLDAPINVTSDDPSGVAPSGTVTVRIDVPPGAPPCPACQQVSAMLDEGGHAIARFPGEMTSAMPAGGYVLIVEYAGDLRYAKGSLTVPNVKIVPPGQVISGSAPVVVSVGDSYISGQGGRWAGNALSSLTSDLTDVGADTYLDAGSKEAIDGCHRAKYSEIHIDQAGADVASVNLSCGGAETSTRMKDGKFKPGLDFWQDENAGWRGQALELYRLASANPGRIRMVALSIGGNDFQFEDVVRTCVKQFLMPRARPCVQLERVTDLFAQANVERQLKSITDAIRNTNDAMTEAGYTSQQWDLVVQDYPSPIPSDPARVRYGEVYARQLIGGCGMFNADMKYANDTALPTINRTVRQALAAASLPNGHFLDLSNAYVGNRLCEKGVDLVGGKWPVKRWTDANALAGSEWVTAIRAESMVHGPYDIGESLHPNYWGGLVNQACLKLVFNAGSVRGGACVRAEGIYPNLDGDNRTYPVMALVDVDAAPNADARPTRAVR
ncbi:MAG: hypothetical protein NTX29_01100 [Actinobacteria bacterium]|nr:hypothetical protein [Actinomycetota bacterium]